MAISNINRKNDDLMAIDVTVNFQEKIFKKTDSWADLRTTPA